MTIYPPSTNPPHCPQGHEVTGYNALVFRQGDTPRCRLCHNAYVLRKHHENNPPPSSRPCAECHTAFTPRRRRDAAYCSPACGQRARRAAARERRDRARRLIVPPGTA